MRRKKREHKALCLILALSIMTFSGCGRGKEPEVGKVRIYYLDTEETQLV